MLVNFDTRLRTNSFASKSFASNREQENKFVKSCQNGDVSAWNELIALHTSRVYGMCYRFTRRECVARDMTQEVFLRIYSKLGSFRADELSFVAWMNLLTLNLLRDNYRRTRKERMTVPIDEHRTCLRNISGSSGRPDEMFAHEETRRMVHSALDKLKPDLREMILLCDVQELQYHEISSRLGIPIGTVKSRLNRARASLAHLLRRHKQAA
jgi:RNA polymerase sigma-70 factor (ECF subfamily)